MKQCKIIARDFLIKDGMNADDAEEAIQPPSNTEMPETLNDRSSTYCERSKDDNPHKLQKCFISLKRILYIEEAVKRGCRSILYVSNPNYIQKKIRFL